MTQATLKAELESVAMAYRRYRLWRGLTLCWVWAAVASGALFVLYKTAGWWSPLLIPLLIAVTGIAAVIVWIRSLRSAPAHRWVARKIEQENPKLKTLLLAAVEQEPDAATGQLSYLQERVVQEAIVENRQQPWAQKHVERLFFAQCAQWAALLLFVVLLTGLTAKAPRSASGSILGVWKSVTVTPGDTSLERGSSLVVLARFDEHVPTEATLVINSAEGKVQRIPLAKNLDDPVFGGSIPEVKGDLAYHIEYGNLQTATYKAKVFDYPSLQRADAQLTFPEYTGQSIKKIEDTRRISAVEGTVVDYTFHLNKPVTSAKLLARDKSTIPLVQDTTRTNVYLAKMTLEQSRRYELQLIDDAGRTNKTPADIVIAVLQNRLPELKLTFPHQDLRASALEEITLQAQVSDDFGLRAYGIGYTPAGKDTQFVELGQATTPNEKRQVNYLLALEKLSAKTDDLLTYFVWADDLGPDGKVRRTSSDMYFAEVRPFEEIFREGQQQPSSDSQQQNSSNNGQASQSEKLAELQKQIINATWKLQRQETASKPSPAYKKDAPVVQEAQGQALEKAQELKTRADENPRLKPLVDAVIKEMERALKQLTEAVEQNSTKPLPPALSAEQSAYQALLKLQAREYEVTRNSKKGQKGGKGGKGGQRAQRQLDQLELKQSENRYETQRQAAAQQQNPEQREQLQVANRLKELAQRQQDLNQRLKEMQTALQEAKTEEEREAAKRQLKRLREEQQEMLADVDELQQRMDRPENQSQMADARQQLDQTRSDVRRAAEELDKEAVSQALASGTRAQRDLQQLRDDFRKKSSSQFSEEMRQMRSEARQLAQKEEEIGQKIEAMSQPQRKSLSDSSERKELADQLNQQRDSLTNLLNNMRTVTEQSEAAEPLLSRQLYDTIRQTDQGRFSGILTNSGELLRRGFIPQAVQLEQQARPILDELKRGVERAAESVLGDDAEALRLARNELDEITRQIEEEIARSGTNRQASAQSGQGAAGQPPNQRPEGRGGAQGQRGGEQGNQQASAQNENSQNGEGQNPGRNGKNQPGNSQQASAGQKGNRGNQTAQNDGQQPGGQQPGGQQAGGQQAGAGQNGGRQQQASAGQRGTPQRRSLTDAEGNNGQRGGQNRGGQRNAADGRGGGGGNDNFTEYNGTEFGGRFGGDRGPLTGNEYTNWSDRLRDIEEMVDLPEVRSRIAQIRDRARGIRAEFKRHSLEPQWSLVKQDIVLPLAEVRSQISEELARRGSKEALVPIDRDPVPHKFSELVRRYYEKLGSSD
jgi:hypothetical protein